MRWVRFYHQQADYTIMGKLSGRYVWHERMLHHIEGCQLLVVALVRATTGIPLEIWLLVKICKLDGV